MNQARTMDVQQERFHEGRHSRGTPRLLDDLAALERLLRCDEGSARPRLEALLGRRLTAHVLHVLATLEPVRGHRAA
jgi:hypothetical protein